MDGDRVVGVQTDREGGTVYADVVILADGVNSLLANRAGFHPELKPRDVALAVKEIHFLPEDDHREPLQRQPRRGRGDRDGRQDHPGHGRHRLPLHQQGVAHHRRRLHAVRLQDRGVTPYQLLEEMKKHPAIKPLIDGGEMKEYTAHLIPEGGYKAMPQIYGDGWMIVGDAGMFVNACTAKARTWP